MPTVGEFMNTALVTPHRGRIVQVLAPAPFGGAETVVRQLAHGLRSDEVDCLIVALGVAKPSEHPWARAMMDDGFEVRCPSMTRVREYRELQRILREPGVLAVHSHSYRADFAAWMARTKSVRWVTTAHGFTGGGFKIRAYEMMDRWLMRRADQVLVVSSLLDSMLRNGRTTAKITLARNVPAVGSPVERDVARNVLGLAPDAIVVGWVGRLSHEKGADRLPLLIADPSTSFVLSVIGDGPLRGELSSQLRALSHVDVRWHGVRHNVGSLVSAFDVLVLPSRTEGMPMVVLEALVAGVPVVAFDVGDVRVAVTEETGWCVRAGDLDAFTCAFRTALTDPRARLQRGARAAELSRTRFSQHDWIRTHREAYGMEPHHA